MDQRIGTPARDTADDNPITAPALAGAVARCWIARFGGLPEIGSLRQAIVTRHDPLACDWCEYPPQMVLGWVEDYIGWEDIRAARLERVPQAGHRRWAA